MKCNVNKSLSLRERKNIIRTTLKQVLAVLTDSEGYGKERLTRVIDGWCELISECEKDSEAMLLVDERLKEKGVTFFDDEEFIIKGKQ